MMLILLHKTLNPFELPKKQPKVTEGQAGVFMIKFLIYLFKINVE